MGDFWSTLFALLAFDRIRETLSLNRAQVTPSSTFMPHRWCAQCSDEVYLDRDMQWKHEVPANHPATPLLSGDMGEPMPDDIDEDWED